MEVGFRNNQAPPVLRFGDTERILYFDAQLHEKDIRTHERLTAGRIIARRLSYAPKHANLGPSSE